MVCKCNLSKRITGDGCDECNPAKALEYARDMMVSIQAHRRMLAVALLDAKCAIEDLCLEYHRTEPKETMLRIQKALGFDD